MTGPRTAFYQCLQRLYRAQIHATALRAVTPTSEYQCYASGSRLSDPTVASTYIADFTNAARRALSQSAKDCQLFFDAYFLKRIEMRIKESECRHDPKLDSVDRLKLHRILSTEMKQLREECGIGRQPSNYYKWIIPVRVGRELIDSGVYQSRDMEASE